MFLIPSSISSGVRIKKAVSTCLPAVDEIPQPASTRSASGTTREYSF